MENITEGKTCGRGCHKVGPILIILFGLLFLAGALNWVGESTVSVTWPVLVIVAGVTKLCGSKCKCC